MLPFSARAETRVSPASFVFAKPGVTTPEQARKLAGAPTEEFEAEVIEGELEPDVVRPNPTRHLELKIRSDKENKPVERVLVLHWRDDVDPRLMGTLVFRGGKAPPDGAAARPAAEQGGTLAWAIVPVSASESSRKKLVQRYGDAPRVRTEDMQASDVRWTRDVIVYGSRGVAYFERMDGSIAYKMIYAPR